MARYTFNQSQLQDPPKTYTINVANMTGGLCIGEMSYKLEDNQSPDCLNMWYANNVLGKRKGQAYLAEYGTSGIISAFEKLFYGFCIYQVGNKLWYTDFEQESPTELFALANTNRCAYRQYGTTVYVLNGADYVAVVGNSSELTAVDVVPYVPTVVVNADPATGSGDLLENYNRIGAGFTVQYSGTSSATVFQLPDTDLDETAPTVVVNGTTLTAEDYTFSAANGTVTLDVGATPNTNGVSITAYKTYEDDVNSILNCRIISAFGGLNEVKIVVGGNPNHPNYFYASATADPTYFPFNLYNIVGTPDDPITAFAGQFNTLIIFKENSIYSANYSLDSDGVVRIPANPVNQNIGCDCPYTVQLINNNLTWLNSKHGVCGLFSTSVENERNVRVLSKNINGTAYAYGLLAEANKQNAVAADIDGRYWLCMNGDVFVWDYSLKTYTGKPEYLSWWKFNNIHPCAFIQDGANTYYARSDEESFVEFTNVFTDYGQAINAYWYSVPFNGDGTHTEKCFKDLYIECRGQTNTTAQLKYITDYVSRFDATPLTTRNFTLLPLSLSAFSLQITKYSKTHHRKPNARFTRHLQIGLFNSVAGEDLSITGMTLQFVLMRGVR